MSILSKNYGLYKTNEAVQIGNQHVAGEVEVARTTPPEIPGKVGVLIGEQVHQRIQKSEWDALVEERKLRYLS